MLFYSHNRYIISSLKSWEEEDNVLNRSFDSEAYEDSKGIDTIDWDVSLSKDGMKLVVISPNKLFFFTVYFEVNIV